jgi:class 3 adenylate cyclase
MSPENLVYCLNRYFESMVAPIIERKGIIDKYIGDAIKAFFGAKAFPGENFALPSVQSALEMSERLVSFNSEQAASGRPEFRNGVGISYGVVTIGNIGTEKKKEYTVIGDTADLAEYLESLTKEYRQPLIISDSLYNKVKEDFPCRLLDSVPWRGGRNVKIYTVRRELGLREKEAWDAHNLAMSEYFNRDFASAAEHFQEVLRVLPQDLPATMLLQRCAEFQSSPPPAGWSGGKVMRAT